uniref:Uncharacterized protein n=1 Tax=Anopheles maculatus TaxID=74869 RepID=A0A182TA23_9DIPT
MYHHQRALLLAGFLLLCFHGDWKTMAEDCVELKVQCAFDCAYREMGFLEAEYDIDVEKIHARNAVYDEAYQQAIANAVDHCMATKDKLIWEGEMLQTACSTFAVKFHSCIVLYVMQNCPADRWDGSPLCEKVKAGVPICKE